MMSNFFSNLKIAIGMGIVCHIVFSFQIDNLFLIKLVSFNVRIFKSATTATDFMIFLKDDLFYGLVPTHSGTWKGIIYFQSTCIFVKYVICVLF